MWLLICDPSDLPALWAYRALHGSPRTPLEVVSSGSLAYALRWEHRLGRAGDMVEITLADGRLVHSEEVRGVVNRLSCLPTQHLAAAALDDRAYAAQELHALFLSWLHVIRGPVLNRPTAASLAGPWRSPAEMVFLAAECGLPTVPYRHSTDDGTDPSSPGWSSGPTDGPARSALVVGRQVVGAPGGPETAEGCRRLAVTLGAGLLGVEFAATDEGWAFTGASVLPDLRQGGAALLRGLESALRGDQ
jgi:hypothetical protein